MIKMIGVELEGQWKNAPDILIHDGSVSFPSECVGNCRSCNTLCNCGTGEVALGPQKTLKDIEYFIKQYYPTKVNKSCGFHVHLSFDDNLDYMNLMTEDFYNYFLEKMEAFGKAHYNKDHAFWNRFYGHNGLLKRGFMPDDQANTTEKYDDSRYYILNFCYGLHKTLECRLFPAYKYRTNFLKILRFYCKIVNEYLVKFDKEKEVAVDFSIRINEAQTVV